MASREFTFTQKEFSSWSRYDEKQKLQDINNKFANYLQRMKSMFESSGHNVESSAFLSSVNILQDELSSLKAMYEKEMDNLRKQVEDSKKEQSVHESQAARLQVLADQLQERLSAETEKNQGLQDQLNCREYDMQDIHMTLSRRIEDLQRSQREHENAKRDADDFQTRFEHEEGLRTQLKDKVNNLQQKLNFQEQVAAKMSDEMKGRLEAAGAMILSLESKLQNLNQNETNFPELLRRMRQAAEADLKQYQADSEEAFNKNLASLRIQVNNNSSAMEMLGDENNKLGEVVGDLEARLSQAEGQVNSLENEKKVLEDQLRNERTRSAEKIKFLQGKMSELNASLIARISEASYSREAFVPLKPEIEAMYALLEEEEKRHCFGAAAPVAKQTIYKYNGLQTGSILGRPNIISGISKSNLNETMTPGQFTSAPKKLCDGVKYDSQMSADMTKLDIMAVPQLEPTAPLRTHSPLHSSQNSTNAATPKPRIQSASDQGQDQSERPQSSTSNDYKTANSSATGDIKIHEVHPQGKYIRMVNSSFEKDADIGGYLLQQNVGGHPVAVYRFPTRVRFATNSTITVWAGNKEYAIHQPPTDFIFKEQEKFGTGPECTTILCKPNGQAIAWTTSSHRFVKDAYENASVSASPNGLHTEENSEKQVETGPLDQDLTELPVDQKSESVFLRREKMEPPSLMTYKHPYGTDPAINTHPSTLIQRNFTSGNDNSSANRQSRSQSTGPDSVPGQPYAGSAAQRMGSAPLRKYTMTNATVRGSGIVANKLKGVITAEPPSPFQKPHHRFQQGQKQIQDQYDDPNHQLPMPCPPLIY